MRYILIFLLFVSQAYGATFAWDHDCVNTDRINLYYGESSGDDKYRVAHISCPATQITLPALDGHYCVTASNSETESLFSNEILLANYYFNSILYDYENNRVLYKGQHTDHDALESDENWVITRYYYDSQGRVVQIRIRTTSWTNRAVGW